MFSSTLRVNIPNTTHEITVSEAGAAFWYDARMPSESIEIHRSRWSAKAALGVWASIFLSVALLVADRYLGIPFPIAISLWIAVLAIGAVSIGALAGSETYNLKRLSIAEDRAFGKLESGAETSTVTPAESAIRLNSYKPDGEIGVLSLASLSQLYTEQIKAYQTEARSRARLSFLFAIIAMFAGFAFVGCGGWYCITSEKVAAGVSVASIGGAVSAFLTATFLRIYRISIEQLHVYFQQPVINDHVVNAQRVAELVQDKDKKAAMYEKIVDKLLSRVESKPLPETPKS